MQLSFFGADAHSVQVAHLEGLLAGPGQVVRSGTSARVSVVLPTPAGEPNWRSEALLAAFDECGVGGEPSETVDGFGAVRTNFRAELLPLATAWARGARKAPPAGFALTGPSLRLWAIAAGQRSEQGYMLRLGDSDEPAWPAVGHALAEAGLPASLVGPRAGGPGYRITGSRRLRGLRELLGDPPLDATESDWPLGSP